MHRALDLQLHKLTGVDAGTVNALLIFIHIKFLALTLRIRTRIAYPHGLYLLFPTRNSICNSVAVFKSNLICTLIPSHTCNAPCRYP